MSGSVLIAVDVQNDFLRGGVLPVPDGNAVIDPINALAEYFDHLILTQDWHPPRHVSFASSHAGQAASDVRRLVDGGDNVLWPDHCLQGSFGAALADGLHTNKAELVIRKGYRVDVDSHSAFREADGTPTGLAGYLRERGFARVVVVGLAIDVCAGFTALDSVEAGFDTMLIEDAARGIGSDEAVARARMTMMDAGVAVCRVSEIIAG